MREKVLKNVRFKDLIIRTSLALAVVAASFFSFGSSQVKAAAADTAVTTGISSTSSLSGITNQNDLRIYQVMVAAFQDGDSNVGYNTMWGYSSGRGDIKGIINSLDYIKGTGCNAIWLTPIFDSTGSGNDKKLDATGYYCTNYFKIDPNFGTLDQVQTLVNTAHSKGIAVLFDGVFGHCSLNVSKTSPYGHTLVTNGKGEYDSPISFPASDQFYEDVASYWINTLGIDGWRLDQAYQVPFTSWQKINQAVQQAAKNKNASSGNTWNRLGYMVAERWDDNRSVINNDIYGTAGNPGLSSAFSFPTHFVLANEKQNSQNGGSDVFGLGGQSASALNDALNADASQYPYTAHPNLFSANHDMKRFGNLLNERGITTSDPLYWKRHKEFLSFLAAYTGPITIMYNDEIGALCPSETYVASKVGTACDDSARIDGKTSGLNSNEQDLYNYTAKIMNLRNQNSALWNGQRTNLTASGNLYADLKVDGSNKVLYALNIGSSSSSITVSKSTVGTDTLVDGLTNETITTSGDNFTINLDANSSRFLIAKESTEPEPTISPDSCSFSNSLDLTLGYNSYTTSATYSINGGAANTYTSGQKVTIGANAGIGDKINVTLTAINGSKSNSKSYTYTKSEPRVVEKGMASLVLPSGWSNPKIYVYDDSGSTVKKVADWPGVSMTKANGSDNIYYYKLPNGWTTAKVIFSSGNNQIPGVNQPGFVLTSDDAMIYKDGTWQNDPITTVKHSNAELQAIDDNSTGAAIPTGATSASGVSGANVNISVNSGYTVNISKFTAKDNGTVSLYSDSAFSSPLTGNATVTGKKVVYVKVTSEDSSKAAYWSVTYNPSSAKTVTIYFQKPDNWTNAFIWYRSDDSMGDIWNTTQVGLAPGNMEAVAGHSGWYKKTVTTPNHVTFLFNDGTWNNKLDTTGFNHSAAGNNFVCDTDVWVTKAGTLSTTSQWNSEKTITIYFQKPNNWNNVFIWYRSDDSKGNVWDTTQLGRAPGKMESVAGHSGWYKKTVTTPNHITFLFNDGTWKNKLDTTGFNHSTAGNNFVSNTDVWVTNSWGLSKTACW